jgi:hypothetical protein
MPSKHGLIYKAITGDSEIPDDANKIWENVCKAKGISEAKCERYGYAVTSNRGSIFESNSYDLDIDSKL